MAHWKLEYCTLVLLSVLQLYKSDCPHNVEMEAEVCLQTYTNTKNIYLGGSKPQLYRGIDVEIIRSICNALSSSGRCLFTLKNRCPETEHALIESKIASQLSMIDLCNHHRIFEKYSLHQSCYQKVSPSSDVCYQTYLSEMTPKMVQLLQSGDRNAYRHLCKPYDDLIVCLKTHVRLECGNEAADLVEILSRPEIKTSDYCRNDTFTTTTKKPTAKPARHNAVSYDIQNSSGLHLGSASLLSLTAVCVYVICQRSWIH